ncbi:unnamed protein product [Jaminaea pallidilutea]
MWQTILCVSKACRRSYLTPQGWGPCRLVDRKAIIVVVIIATPSSSSSSSSSSQDSTSPSSSSPSPDSTSGLSTASTLWLPWTMHRRPS